MLGNTVLGPADRGAEPDHEDARRRAQPALLAAIREELLRQADLFDDPDAYGAGVLDALEALSSRLAPSTTRGATPEGSLR